MGRMGLFHSQGDLMFIVTFQNLSLHLVRNKEKEMDVCNGRGREHEGKQRATSLLISLHA
jgi:hypothetical protein